ncbi:MAG: hypothetical protein SVQ76_02095 [Candidatus Nanohaloarchaea archaeon]|nr:hypothetical protein [Candidatus Nanohaloarchaea archaeon]
MDRGPELVDDLIELQDAYNSYLATTNGVSQVGITDQEAQKYKGEVLQFPGYLHIPGWCSEPFITSWCIRYTRQNQ